MSDLEKALTWHKLGKWTSPNAASVKHVDAIVAELERLRAPKKAYYDNPVMIDGFPRHARMDHWTPAERAIDDALQLVESVGADPLLTDAVILLGDARRKVAEYVDRQIQAAKPA